MAEQTKPHQFELDDKSADFNADSIEAEIGGKGATAVLIVALMTGTFMVVEFAGGVYTGSVSLLADACYMLVDSAALGFAWLLMKSHLNESQERERVYAELSSRFGFLMGIVLLFAGVVVGGIAIARLIQDEPLIMGKLMFWIGIVGLVVNSISLAVLGTCHLSDMNARDAMRHVVNDIVGSIAVIAAAVAILLGTGWFVRVDAILALAFVMLMLFNGVTSIQRSQADSRDFAMSDKPDSITPPESNVW